MHSCASSVIPSKAAFVALVAGMLGTNLSCGKAPEAGRAEIVSATAENAVVVAEQPSIRGRVILAGGRPSRLSTLVDVGPNTFCLGHGAIFDPTWKVAGDGGLADVVVSVLGAPPASNIDPHPVLIDQRECLFVPHVTVLQAGQVARIRNDDATFHNVRIALHEVGTRSGGQNQDNFGQPSKGFESLKQFSQPGVYRLECDVHRWMKSWVVAHDSVHVAVTAADGSFEIPRELKDGTYTVEAWHPQFAQKLSQTVEVAQGRGQADFTFQLADSFDP